MPDCGFVRRVSPKSCKVRCRRAALPLGRGPGKKELMKPLWAWMYCLEPPGMRSMRGGTSCGSGTSFLQRLLKFRTVLETPCQSNGRTNFCKEGMPMPNLSLSCCRVKRRKDSFISIMSLLASSNNISWESSSNDSVPSLRELLVELTDGAPALPNFPSKLLGMEDGSASSCILLTTSASCLIARRWVVPVSCGRATWKRSTEISHWSHFKATRRQ
mmetsp:Transcript_36931/g.68841  ORF Transcript_36931/g.68841 Transcript_36931/m.68841 type:complete len:216 (+) Transcript_36931:346-993(+)